MIKAEEVGIRNVLKRLMKSQGLEYKHLAKTLGISEATVKRRLNKGQMTMSQLLEISEVLGYSLKQVIDLNTGKTEPHQFTEAQEKLLASDPKYILILRQSLVQPEMKEIMRRLSLTESQMRSYLRGLENAGLAALMLKDRVRPLFKFPVRWIDKGPLHRAYSKKHVDSIAEYTRKSLASPKEAAGLIKTYFEFYLTSETAAEFSKELREIYEKYMIVSRQLIDAKNTKGDAYSLILLLDQFSIWELSDERQGL